MLTEFQKKKIHQIFNNHDFDGNGYLEKTDFEEVVDSFCKTRNYSKESSEYNKLESNYMNWWNELQKLADTNNDDKITLGEWFTAWESILASQDTYNQVVPTLINLIFDIADADGDGTISQEEYVRLYGGLNLSEKEATESFLKVDVNGDGIIYKQEYEQLFYEFYYSDDPNAPGNWVAGPLS